MYAGVCHHRYTLIVNRSTFPLFVSTGNTHYNSITYRYRFLADNQFVVSRRNIGYPQINLQFFWCLLINKIRFPNKRRSAQAIDAHIRYKKSTFPICCETSFRPFRLFVLRLDKGWRLLINDPHGSRPPIDAVYYRMAEDLIGTAEDSYAGWPATAL